MLPIPTGTLLALVGTLVQLAGCLLLTGFGFALSREANRQNYFRYWAWAWLAVSVGVAAIAVRYLRVPFVYASIGQEEPTGQASLLYGLYQCCKVLSLALLLAGTVVFATRQPLGPRQRFLGAALALATALGTAATARDLNMMVMMQAAYAAPLFAVCAAMVQTLPRERRGLGPQTMSLVFSGLVLLWVLYFFAFSRGQAPPVTNWQRFLSYLSGYNSYVDSVFQLMLGLGMMLTLLEESHREADEARVARLKDLAESEHRLAELVRSAHEGIVTLDAARLINNMNPAAQEIFRTGGEPQGQSFDAFLREDQRESFWAALSAPVRRSEAAPSLAARRALVGVRADGESFPMEVSLSTFGGGPEPAGYVLILRDLTAQLQAREEYERLQLQLAQAARLEAVGRMVSGVAHELNNPLTAILAFGQDLLLERRSQEDRDALTVIVQQADRCRVIVGDLLIFARSRREERRPVEPQELAARVLRVFERDSARQRLELEMQVPRTLPAVEVDGVGMEQVLTNLLTNAIQAAGPGGRIVLRARVAGERLEFIVEDSGPGLRPEIMSRIFEPFFTTKEPGEGTGLGLSVSHAIVQQHGGTIRAENREGESGARFTVAIPFLERRARSRVVGDDGDVAAPAPGDGGSGRRVLVVEDESSIRSAIRRSLERRGWVVEEATDGAEALLKLTAAGLPASYDAIVSDVRMPGVSGMELHDRLAVSRPEMLDRLIMITGDIASPAAADFMARLKRPFLQKPFEMRALADLLDQVAPRSAA